MIRIGTLLLLTCLLFACEVATVKTVDLPPAPERLVVLGLATNLGVGVFVSKTYPVLAPKEEALLLEAEVRLRRGTTTLTELRKDVHLYLSDSAWAYSQEYVLSVKHPSLGEASARLAPLPAGVPIQKPTATVANEFEADVSFAFRDRPGPDYYAYRVVPLVEGKPLTKRSVYEIDPGSVFSDLGFENQEKTVKARLTRTFRSSAGPPQSASQFRIFVYHLSKDTYEYYRSLREYDSYNDDTFTGNLLVANNIMNGYGFVGTSYVDSTTVSLR
jgi:hypothetical protein